MARTLLAALLLGLAGCVTGPAGAWQAVATPGTASLRGIAVVDARTVWVSGAGGTVWRTTDGGASWRAVAPPGTQACDFRDVEALDANTALVLVAGQPARLYRTTDGGASWRVVFADARPEAFLDGVALDGAFGALFGDPIDGTFLLATTNDGGANWSVLPRERLPAPLVGEAAFAASGTCLAVHAGSAAGERVWVATGGAARARLLRGDEHGLHAIDVPLAAGAASRGGFGLARRGPRAVLVGGDYAAPGGAEHTAAWSDDDGRTWHAGSAGGFRSAAVWLDDARVLAVGSHGTSRSRDGGRTWAVVGDLGFHCLARGRDGSVWAAGSDGRVARWREP